MAMRLFVALTFMPCAAVSAGLRPEIEKRAEQGDATD
jgi:hypothetical protein